MPNKFGDISSNIDILDGQVLRSKTDGTGFESYDIESALNNKADQSTTYTKTETDNLLDNKLEADDIVNFETTTQLNTRDTVNRNRINHTGTQTASTISDFDTEVSNNTDVAANTTARHTHSNKATLDQIASNPVETIVAGTNVTVNRTGNSVTINSTGGGGGATVLDDLTDVTITTPANGQALTYNGTQWVNSTPAGGGDMLKSVYDTNDDGIVNQADIITNQGDLATLDSVDTAQITNGAVENTKLANMNANTVKGRLSGNGTPQDVAMADLPISTATQTALNGKQATLVSGTNIKTINGTSVLGSGDIEVGGDPLAVVSDVTGVTGADRVTNIISLTKAEYDAITPDASTIYNITDDAVEYEGKVGTKVVDETAIGDDKILVYKTASGKLEYEAKPSGGTVDISCSIYKSNTQNLNSTFSTISFNEESFDTDGMHDNAINNSRITFNTAGKYLINGVVLGGNTDNTGNSISVGAKIILNGTTELSRAFTGEGNFYINYTANISLIREFSIGDYIELQGFTSYTLVARNGITGCSLSAIKF